ncbi:MAG: DUF452 family protein, partial [Muribaculaceae bacterium]|nr:DUF452 family protein [Muribaculaceae bacterium]
MKIEFIKRGAATRLILIFAGWSTDARYYSDCTVEGCDTAVISDYRDMEMPAIPEQYKTLYIFAYSLGVAAAAASRVPAAARIGICGSLVPASDRFGIPSSIYQGTLDGLNEKTLSRFHLRMAGDRKRYAEIIKSLPSSPDIEALKEELDYVRRLSQSELMDSDVRFDRVYIAEDDKIFPYKNLTSFWQQRDETTVVIKRGPHAVDLASIINECIPDAAGIGEGFQRAGISYMEHALVQSEICRRLAERLSELLPSDK